MRHRWIPLIAFGVSALVHAQVSEMRGALTLSFEQFRANIPGPFQPNGGMTAEFQNYFPGFGRLSGNIEMLSTTSSWRNGNSYVDIDDVRLGTFRLHGTLGNTGLELQPINLLFSNLPFPRPYLTGASVAISGERWQATVFRGEQSILQGIGIPLRFRTGQVLTGIKTQRTLGNRLQVGAYLVNFSPQKIQYVVNETKPIPNADNAGLETLWKPVKSIQLYGEGSWSRFRKSSTDAQGTAALSTTLQGTWETRRTVLRASYVRHSSSYLPLAGYVFGSRSGPFAELRFKFGRGEVFGSGSRLTTAYELQSALSRFEASTFASGASISLPGRIEMIGQFTSLRVETPTVPQSTQIESVRASRRFGAQTVHLELRDISTAGISPLSQKSLEVGDDLHFRRMTFLAAAQFQRVDGTTSSTNMVYRGGTQLNLPRLSFFMNAELGTDLASRSLLTNSLTQNCSAGLEWQLNGWRVSAQAWSSRLLLDFNRDLLALSAVNPAFGTGILAYSRWSVFAKISRDFQWGGARSVNDVAQYSRVNTPFTGAIIGRVLVSFSSGKRPASGVPIILDGDRVTFTDSEGFYEIRKVPEGQHTVTIDERRLPVDYGLNADGSSVITVSSGQRIRANFEVQPLTLIKGKIQGPEGVSLERIVVRLYPGNRHVSTDRLGNFEFRDLPEGEYEIKVDDAFIPSGTKVADEVTIIQALTTDVAMIQLRLRSNPTVPLVRQIVLEQ